MQTVIFKQAQLPTSVISGNLTYPITGENEELYPALIQL